MAITTSKLNRPLMPVKIGDKIVKYVQKPKCLGIIIDQQPNWKQQVDAVRNSYCTKLKLLTRLNYLPFQNNHTIGYMLHRCWASSAESGLRKLIKAHTRAARIVNQLPKDHDKKLHWRELDGFHYHVYTRREL